MNTLASTARTGHARILLEREFWEHKGGFLWAPLVAGAIALALGIMVAIWATVTGRQRGTTIEMPDTARVPELLGAAGDMALLSGVGIAALILGFVVFFYALGSLYDDRKDRSVLFWKSMPVSDTATVASKVAWAAVLAPMLAIAIGLVIGLGMWLLGMATTTVNGLSGASGILTHSHLFRITGQVLAMIPVYALWALPAIGWLMLCSAAARTKPFLWAVMIPVLACTMISMFSAMLGVGGNVDDVWYAVAYRGLLSVFPGTWLPTLDSRLEQLDGPQDLPAAFGAITGFDVLGTMDLWIGVAVGVVMIAAAIRLRRWRDEG